jgi:hypothetical protein
VARVTAFLEKKMFVEGAEVNKGDLLYQLTRLCLRPTRRVSAVAPIAGS